MKNLELEVSESIKYFITSQFETKDYDKFIHLIWYYLTGTRLENLEVEVLKELGKQYSIKSSYNYSIY